MMDRILNDGSSSVKLDITPAAGDKLSPDEVVRLEIISTTK